MYVCKFVYKAHRAQIEQTNNNRTADRECIDAYLTINNMLK